MKQDKLINRFGRGVLSGLALIVLNNWTSAQTIKVKTELPQNRLVADGTTIYKLDINVDSTEFPDKKINSTNWDVYLPPFFSFVNASLPSINDFFDGFSMDPAWNFVDSTPSSAYGGNLLDMNTRNTLPVNNGPLNRIGNLENIYFTVNINAPIGSNNPNPIPNHDIYNNFFVEGVNFSDTTGTLYKKSNQNLTHYPFIPTQSFTICADVQADVTGPIERRDG